MRKIYHPKKYSELFLQGKFEDAISYRRGFIPQFLYRFYSLRDEGDSENPDETAVRKNKRNFSDLEQDRIWFSVPDNLNDPYEFRTLYYDRDALSECGFSERLQAGLQNLIRAVPVACFTEYGDANLPMWAHYANNHKGFCVKYEVLDNRRILNVTYQDSRIDITPMLLQLWLNRNKALIQAKSGERENLNHSFQVLIENLFMKHDSWSYEKEYRIALPEKVRAMKKKKGVYMPVNELGLKTSEVISGFQCSDGHREELRRICERTGVPFKTCTISGTEYAMFCEPQ